MQQYLKITNQGLILEEDLILIGSSSKREDDSKIGMFGSGWKYALAWLIRNDCTPLIYSGTNRIDVDYRATLHRNNPVRIITVNGKDTSLTAEMGPQWTGWMAVREIVSNAIDEGQYTITTELNPVLAGAEGITTVIVPMIKELSEMMMSYQSYFAFDREPTITNKYGHIYLKHTASKLNIYRKGIRCFEPNDTSKYLDYSFETIDINESRLTQTYYIEVQIRNIMSAGNITPAILKAYCLDGISASYPPRINGNIQDCLIKLYEEGHRFTTESIRKLIGIMAGSESSLIIPIDWYNVLVGLGYAQSLTELLDGDGSYKRTDKRETSGILHYLKEFNITTLEVVSGKFEGMYNVLINKDTAVILDDDSASDKDLAAQILSRLPQSWWYKNMH